LLLVGKERGDEKKVNKLLLDDMEFKMKYDCCDRQAEHPKKGA
jgi:hypothetical protein